MASAADLVLLNFVWRIETISPTSTLAGKKFRHQDYSAVLSPEQSSGTTRGFTVQRLESSPFAEPSDMYDRIADHTYEVAIAYTTDIPLERRERVIAQDGHDIKKQLRDHTKWNGTSGSDSAVDTGLWNRRLEREFIDRSSATTYYLRQTWRCTIREAEA